MKRRFWYLGLLILSTQILYAQNNEQKVGLVLSGGGAKGFAHLGVIKALEEHNIPIDIISGTSMGAIVGGLYSIGYSADSLIQIFKAITWSEMYSDEVGRNFKYFDTRKSADRYQISLPVINNEIQLPEGVISGQRFLNAINTYTLPIHDDDDFKHLIIPFRAVSTNLLNGEAYVFQSGSLAIALRASMSVPTILRPFEFDGTKLIDGGISRNLPVQDAIDMGADFVIASDVGQPSYKLEELNSIINILDQSFSFQIIKSTEEQKILADFVLTPQVAHLGSTDFNRIDTLIKAGYETTLQHIDEIKSKINIPQTTRFKTFTPIPNLEKKYLINDIIITGSTKIDISQLLYALNIEKDNSYSLNEINSRINKLYGNELFELISFKLIPQSEGYELELYLQDSTTNNFKLGLRFDNRYNAAFIFNLTFRNSFLDASIFSIDVRIGEESFLELWYKKFQLIKPRLSFTSRLRYIQTILPDFNRNGNKSANYHTNAVYGQLEFNSMYSNLLNLNLFIREEFYVTTPEIAPINTKTVIAQFPSYGFTFMVDNLNSTYFTQSGNLIQTTGIIAPQFFGSKESFTQLIGLYKGYLKIKSYLTLFTKASSGFTLGNKLPHHYKYRMGGNFSSKLFEMRELPFYGSSPRAISSRSFQIVSVGTMAKPIHDHFLTLSYNIGNFDPVYSIDVLNKHWKHGFAIAYGIRTLLGPAEVSFSTGSDEPLIFGVSLGFNF